MGVKGLYTYLRSYRRDRLYESVAKDPPLRIGFDAMSLLYKYKGGYTEIYPMLQGLKAAGHKLLFVFDGKPPTEKEAEVKERRDIRNSASTQAETLRGAMKNPGLSAQERTILEYSLARLEFQGWHMTREIRHTVQAELWTMEIPYVKAIGEADDALSELVGAGKLDVIVSTDMDFLLSGVPRLWIPFRSSNDGFEEIALTKVLDGETLSLEMFRDAGILCGVEGLRGKVSFPPTMAFSWIRYYKDIEGILQGAIKDPQLDHLRDEALLQKVRASFTAGKAWKETIRPDHLDKVAAFMEAL